MSEDSATKPSQRKAARGRDIHEPHRTATPLELLFDLTFVIAVATAASQLSEAASGLSTSATEAVREASRALETMSTLESASAQIEQAVRVISGVAVSS